MGTHLLRGFRRFIQLIRVFVWGRGRFGRETCQLKSMFTDKTEFCSKLSKLPRSSMGLVPVPSLETQCQRTDFRVAGVCEPLHQLCRETGRGHGGPGGRAPPGPSPVISAPPEKASPAWARTHAPRVLPAIFFASSLRGPRSPSLEIQPRLGASPVRHMGHKSSAKPLKKLPLLLELPARRAHCRVAKTVGFFSQEPYLDAEMEPSVTAFLNSEIRWTVKDFRTPRRSGFRAGERRAPPPAPCAPCGPRGASGLRAEPARGSRRRVL